MKKLPEDFIRKMTGLWGSGEFMKYQECLERPMEHGLRVNTLRLDPEEFDRISPWELSPVPWCRSGRYLEHGSPEGADTPSRHPFYHAGVYYLQEPSAMLPAAQLPVNPGDRVLDLCAAPGGKSTALAEKLKNSGVLVCNDISATRAKALIKNLELFGVSNAVVTAETPERLASVFPDYFDRILIDAPCSGEGMFRKSGSMIADWTMEKPEEYAAIQRDILPHALRMLRPGGTLLYSTCTYSPEEDEASVMYLLSLPEAKEKELILMNIPSCPGFLPGDPDWVPEGIPELNRTVHLIPHRVRGEGHYAALFQSGSGEKAPEDPDLTGYRLSRDRKAVEKNLEPVRRKLPGFFSFAAGTDILWDNRRIEEKEGYLSYVPDVPDLPSLKGLRVLRRGLFLGEEQKNRFQPSQALAMTLSPESFPNTLNLNLSDQRAIRYLRGETLEYEEGEVKDGWVLISLMGFPLGFGKAANGRIKNKYLPAWRIGA